MHLIYAISAILNIALGTGIVLTPRPRVATVDEVAQMRARLHA